MIQQIHTAMGQQRGVEDGDKIQLFILCRRFINERCTRLHKIQIIIVCFQSGFYQADSRHGIYVLARNKVGAETLHNTLKRSIDIILYLGSFAHQGH